MVFRLLLAALLLGALPASAAKAFRGRLDGESSPMVFVAAGRGMSLAYDERGGSLLLAWQGRAEALPGPGGIYRAAGKPYHRRTSASPWSVRGPNGILPVTVTLKVIDSSHGLPTLEWSLRLPDGRRISVSETPAFDDHYGDPGLFRDFRVAGIPAGHLLRLDLTGTGLPESWGGGGEGALEEEAGRRLMVQSRDGDTPLKVTWSAAPAGGDPSLHGGWK